MNAPVAIFVYNRLDNTQTTIQHLKKCAEARETDVYVFSDGGKDKQSWSKVNAVRDYLHKVKDEAEQHHSFKSFCLIERPENIYLERNITEGIAYVLERHDRIIVLEDDIVVSPYYLQYMNHAFDLYKDTPMVMHVAGFSNLDLKDTPYYFTPHMSGWGWGTWKDRWNTYFKHFQTEEEALEGMSAEDQNAIQYGGVFPCLRSLKRNPIPWDICWEIAIYKANGLCLTPGHTMVRNIGLMNGTHFRASSLLQHYEFDRQPLDRPLDLSWKEPYVDPQIEQQFAEAIRDWGIRYTALGKVLRKMKHAFDR